MMSAKNQIYWNQHLNKTHNCPVNLSLMRTRWPWSFLKLNQFPLDEELHAYKDIENIQNLKIKYLDFFFI